MSGIIEAIRGFSTPVRDAIRDLLVMDDVAGYMEGTNYRAGSEPAAWAPSLVNLPAGISVRPATERALTRPGARTAQIKTGLLAELRRVGANLRTEYETLRNTHLTQASAQSHDDLRTALAALQTNSTISARAKPIIQDLLIIDDIAGYVGPTGFVHGYETVAYAQRVIPGTTPDTNQFAFLTQQTEREITASRARATAIQARLTGIVNTNSRGQEIYTHLRGYLTMPQSHRDLYAAVCTLDQGTPGFCPMLTVTTPTPQIEVGNTSAVTITLTGRNIPTNAQIAIIDSQGNPVNTLQPANIRVTAQGVTFSVQAPATATIGHYGLRLTSADYPQQYQLRVDNAFEIIRRQTDMTITPDHAYQGRTLTVTIANVGLPDSVNSEDVVLTFPTSADGATDPHIRVSNVRINADRAITAQITIDPNAVAVDATGTPIHENQRYIVVSAGTAFTRTSANPIFTLSVMPGTCTDHIDNDLNGLTDRQDLACQPNQQGIIRGEQEASASARLAYQVQQERLGIVIGTAPQISTLETHAADRPVNAAVASQYYSWQARFLAGAAEAGIPLALRENGLPLVDRRAQAPLLGHSNNWTVRLAADTYLRGRGDSASTIGQAQFSLGGLARYHFADSLASMFADVTAAFGAIYTNPNQPLLFWPEGTALNGTATIGVGRRGMLFNLRAFGIADFGQNSLSAASQAPLPPSVGGATLGRRAFGAGLRLGLNFRDVWNRAGYPNIWLMGAGTVGEMETSQYWSGQRQLPSREDTTTLQLAAGFRTPWFFGEAGYRAIWLGDANPDISHEFRGTVGVNTPGVGRVALNLLYLENPAILNTGAVNTASISYRLPDAQGRWSALSAEVGRTGATGDYQNWFFGLGLDVGRLIWTPRVGQTTTDPALINP